MERLIEGVTFVAACTTGSDFEAEPAVLGCSVLAVLGVDEWQLGLCPVCSGDEWRAVHPGWATLGLVEADVDG